MCESLACNFSWQIRALCNIRRLVQIFISPLFALCFIVLECAIFGSNKAVEPAPETHSVFLAKFNRADTKISSWVGLDYLSNISEPSRRRLGA